MSYGEGTGGALRYVIAGFVALVGLTILWGSWYTVDEGERGVILRNGAVSGVAAPGLGFKIPMIDSIQTFSVQSRLIRYEQVAAYSRDQQPANIMVSINYRLMPDQVTTIYTNFGSEDAVVNRLIGPRVYAELKTIFGAYNAEAAIRERGRLNSEVREAINRAVGGPVEIDGVQIENIDFSDAFEQAVEQRAQAEVEVAKIEQNARREKVTAQITVTKAIADADAVRAAAQAEADAIKLRGEAEATAIKARAAALAENPNLVALTQAERWNGVLPSTMVPGGAVPMLTLGR